MNQSELVCPQELRRYVHTTWQWLTNPRNPKLTFLQSHSDMFPLFRELEGKITLGRGLLEKLATPKLKNVQGVAKLEKKVPYFLSQSVDHIF